MKTFDEAVLAVAVPVADGRTVEDAMQAAQAAADRTASLKADIEENVVVIRVLASLFQQHHEIPLDLMRHAFYFGLRIGMEMERSETGGVKLT